MSEFEQRSERVGAPHLLVFLPGLGDEPADVVEGGLLEELSAAPQFDVVVADAHFGFYRDQSLLERLRDDVIHPRRSKYDELWLVGISMGGYGAVAYAERYPGEVQGVILLAPYLGKASVMTSIEEAGGLKSWLPESVPNPDPRTAHSVALWSWLKQRPDAPDEPLLFMSSGAGDAHMRQLELLRPVLPEERVRVAKGGHDWPVWRSLFGEFVEHDLSRR